MTDEEFWEKCGFKFNKDERGWGRDTWIDPRGNTCLHLPFINLTNLFEYAVPKLIEKGDVGFVKWDGKRTQNQYTVFTNGKRFCDTDDPAQGLYRAIRKVMNDDV